MKKPTPTPSELEQAADEILTGMRAELLDFLQSQANATSSSTYENSVLDLARQFAQKVAAQQDGPLPKSRNAKKKS